MTWSAFSQMLIANFFFIDVVGLSKPGVPTSVQIEKINTLNRMIAESGAFSQVPEESKFVLPTGDGAAIAFVGNIEAPLQLAVELHGRLREHNAGKKARSEMVHVRIGIHSGPVVILKDLQGHENIWGSGIVMARRLMDLGNRDHILISSDYVRILRAASESWPDYKDMIHRMGYYKVKHGVRVLVYSAYSGQLGNKSLPAAGPVAKQR